MLIWKYSLSIYCVLDVAIILLGEMDMPYIYSGNEYWEELTADQGRENEKVEAS